MPKLVQEGLVKVLITEYSIQIRYQAEKMLQVVKVYFRKTITTVPRYEVTLAGSQKIMLFKNESALDLEKGGFCPLFEKDTNQIIGCSTVFEDK